MQHLKLMLVAATNGGEEQLNTLREREKRKQKQQQNE
jgi:hypothetical protein